MLRSTGNGVALGTNCFTFAKYATTMCDVVFLGGGLYDIEDDMRVEDLALLRSRMKTTA